MAVLSIGHIGNAAAKAIQRFEQEADKSVAHYDMRFLKPIDEEILEQVARNFTHILTIEDGSLSGGMGSAVMEYMAEHGFTPHIHRIGIPDMFVEHGTIAELHKICHMDEESIYNKLKTIADLI